MNHFLSGLLKNCSSHPLIFSLAPSKTKTAERVFVLLPAGNFISLKLQSRTPSPVKNCYQSTQGSAVKGADKADITLYYLLAVMTCIWRYGRCCHVMEMLLNQSLVVTELINPEIHVLLNSLLPSRTFFGRARLTRYRQESFFLNKMGVCVMMSLWYSTSLAGWPSWSLILTYDLACSQSSRKEGES